MKVLGNLLKNIELIRTAGNLNVPIRSIEADSRKIEKDDVFVAVRGTQVDGHQFIDKAIEQGARVVVCESIPEHFNPQITWIQVADSSKALGRMACNYYDNPSEKLKLVGITGTNGKTTTVTLLYRLFESLGYKAGLISTVIYKVHDESYEATHTTPDALTINKLLSEMVNRGCTYAFMEVSSHSLVQHRTEGLKFAVAIFSNITHDHLDYHKTFDEYIKAKKMLFDSLSPDAYALVNLDDKNGRVMVQNTKAMVKTYAMRTMADFMVKVVESHFDGMHLQINGIDMHTPFIGHFNAYNLLAVYGTSVLLGVESTEALTHLSALHDVPGRFQAIRSSNGILAIVDYAHTPDALVNVLNTINQLRKGNEQLITVVGAGGNRDKTKRPVMAKVCVEQSDRVILTSDNPRNEDPNDIINDMLAGVDSLNRKKVLTITDRAEAIRTATLLAKPGDIILLAGKGHETYQEIKGVKHHFDDREEIKKAFENL
ncbi:MAG: UDP-N-acetylmuramoyl-L-alanyl-D-glutamate--2,6-diaminopimelate ligase [Bacteroidales bacterium]|nr:UDP-N-acetylmuramoyl-L-alanyl-D-glutamate--2,6-diaminopimelate ligase [Bacteroidales bacterium]